MQKISSFKPQKVRAERSVYYPPVTKDIECIASYLDGWGFYFLDPCCGAGENLELLRMENNKINGACRIGIEPDEARAQRAIRREAGIIINENFNNVQLEAGKIGCIYLDPPCDENGTHCRFLEKSTEALIDTGVLIYTTDRDWIDDRISKHFTSYYVDLRVYKSHDKMRDRLIIMGKKAKEELSPNDKLMQRIKTAKAISKYSYSRSYWDVRYYIPSRDYGGNDIDISITYLDPEQIKEEIRDFSHDWEKILKLIPEATVVKRPLMPLRRGHLAQVLTSGLMDGVFTKPSTGEKLLVKGTVQKVTEVTDVKEATETLPEREVRLTRDAVSILLLDERGRITNIK